MISCEFVMINSQLLLLQPITGFADINDLSHFWQITLISLDLKHHILSNYCNDIVWTVWIVFTQNILLADVFDYKIKTEIDIRTKWDTCTYENSQSVFELVPKYIMHISIIDSTEWNHFEAQDQSIKIYMFAVLM